MYSCGTFEDKKLALEAIVVIRVIASPEQIDIKGVVPIDGATV